MTDDTMREAAQRKARAQRDGTRDELADFVWACDAYGAYIDELRRGKRLEDD